MHANRIADPSSSVRAGQRGFALLLLLLALVLAGAFIIVSEANSRISVSERRARTITVLAQAKDALIARSTLDNNRPGSLPCPDLNGDGTADLLIGNQCPGYLGWLPWRTLGLPDPRDGFGERLWYALSPTFRDDDSAEPINNSTPALLTLDGVPGVAAIVFASGGALEGQSRPSQNSGDYLEGENADGDNDYAGGPESATFNDLALPLTGDELMRMVERRVAGEVLNRLDAYFAANGAYPYPATPGCTGGTCDSDRTVCRGRLPVHADLDSSGPGSVSMADWAPSLPSWLTNNRWPGNLYYAVGSSSLKSPGTAITDNCNPNPTVDGVDFSLVLITPGPPKAGSVRPSTSLADYLDDAANQDGWDGSGSPDAYVTPTSSANDRIFRRP